MVTGRALLSDDLQAEEYESVFARLHAISLNAPFDIKTTEAQHYRRYIARLRQPGRPTTHASAIRRQIAAKAWYSCLILAKSVQADSLPFGSRQRAPRFSRGNLPQWAALRHAAG